MNQPQSRPRPVPPRLPIVWYAAMLAGGFAFGLIGDRRPFGDDVFAHPVVLFFMAAIAGLLVLRAVLQRPVPEVIPERVLAIGGVLGAAAFFAGNWVAAHVLT
jgi:hypothetical protein